MDAITRELLQNEVLELWERNGRMTGMLITHDIDEAILMADRVVVVAGPPGRISLEVPVDIPRPRSARAVRSDRSYPNLGICCGTPCSRPRRANRSRHDRPARAGTPAAPGAAPKLPRAPKAVGRTMSPTARWAPRLSSILLIALAWELYGRAVNPVLLSYPAIVRAAGQMLSDGSLSKAFGESMVVLGVGSLIGVGAGLAIGLAAGRNQTFATFIELPLNALYATPTVALIPVIVVWFGFGPAAKTVVVTLSRCSRC